MALRPPVARTLAGKLRQHMVEIDRMARDRVGIAAISESLADAGIEITPALLSTYLYRWRKAQRSGSMRAQEETSVTEPASPSNAVMSSDASPATHDASMPSSANEGKPAVTPPSFDAVLKSAGAEKDAFTEQFMGEEGRPNPLRSVRRTPKK